MKRSKPLESLVDHEWNEWPVNPNAYNEQLDVYEYTPKVDTEYIGCYSNNKFFWFRDVMRVEPTDILKVWVG